LKTTLCISLNLPSRCSLSANWRDQFGPHPPAVENLLVCAAIKLAAAHARISSVDSVV
jgi:transcription-repair coupling factor (superfamily II helicase)